MFKIKGKIKWVGKKMDGTSTGADGQTRNWSKIDIMIEETEERYPNSVVLSIFGEEKIAEYMPCVDEMVTASFDTKARSFKRADGSIACSTDLRLFKLEKHIDVAPQPKPQPQPAQAPQQTYQGNPFEGANDDMPF